MTTLYTDILYPLQDKVLSTIAGLDSPFYLTGGTALARHYYHHRYSDDLDFFVNDYSGFTREVERIEKTLKAFSVTILARSESYIAFMVENKLRVEFVNDVKFHTGAFESGALFTKIDNVVNILSNKITALMSRDNPKDVADVWIIATHNNIDWRSIYTDVSSKAVGIFPPYIAKKLETFPSDLLDTIKWAPGYKPTKDEFKKTMDAVIEDMLKV